MDGTLSGLARGDASGDLRDSEATDVLRRDRLTIARLAEVFFNGFLRFTGALLDATHQFLLAALDILQVVVSEARPLLFQRNCSGPRKA